MIVIPMAGMSRRFTEAGYTRPKYMLEARGRSLFAHAVASFEAYFATHPFLFIARDISGTPGFIRSECEALGIARFNTVVLDAPTAGQAETVMLGLDRGGCADESPVTVFNIDTFRPHFRFPTGFDLQAVDGYLEVFRGGGDNWSFVRAAGPGSDHVVQTTEKVPISDLCCTGLYHFRSAGLYRGAYPAFRDGGAAAMGLKELYVAPLYNLLIAEGRDIRFDLVPRDAVIFCGVPAEYDEFRVG